MNKLELRKTTIYLPSHVQGRLRNLSKATGRSQAELIRAALEAYLEHEQAPLPQSIGVVDDAGLEARDVKAWLRENWRPD